MAFYDYKCNKCGKIFEIQKGMNEEVQAKCSFCASPDTSRKFNSFRRMASKGESFKYESREMSNSCGSCSSGVCSSCNH